MTPEEKAKELVERHHQCMYHDMGDGKMGYVNRARHCALICVDEILDYLEDAVTIVCEDGGEKLDPTLYWRQVKQQIQKL